MQIWVYIVKCADGSYYTGTHRGPDPAVRVAEHNHGARPEAYTYSRRPVTLVWADEFEDPNDAISFERQLKGWNRRKKEAVIRGEWTALPGLARRAGPFVKRDGPSFETPPDGGSSG